MRSMAHTITTSKRRRCASFIHAGLRRAVANGKTLGRPLNDPKAIDKARQWLVLSDINADHGLSPH